MSRMDAGLKRRLGYVLYMIECFAPGPRFRFPTLRRFCRQNGHGGGRVVDVSQLLAVRVRSFGGVLNKLAPGASLNNGNLSLLAFKTQSRMRYLKFLLAALAGRHTFNGAVELLETPSLSSAAPITALSNGCWWKRMEKCWGRCRCGWKWCPTR